MQEQWQYVAALNDNTAALLLFLFVQEALQRLAGCRESWKAEVLLKLLVDLGRACHLGGKPL